MTAISLIFSGEEAHGRYLDLQTNYAAYNNLKNLKKRLSYLQYLDTLLASQNTQLHSELPLDIRTGSDYEAYAVLESSGLNLIPHRYISALYAISSPS